MKSFYIFYLIIPLYMMLLAILSIGERIPLDSEKNASGIEKLFLRTASYIYRRFLKRNRFFLNSPGRRHVKDNLLKLDSEGDINKKVSAYYVRKMSTMLILVFTGSLLALLAGYSAGRQSVLSQDGKVLRNDYGQGEKEAKLVAVDANGENLGNFNLSIGEMEYTEEKANEIYKQLIEELPMVIIGENEDLNHVKTDLNLPDHINGYPFEISWKSDNADVLSSDGKPQNEDISFNGEKVFLTANIKYRDYEWEHVFSISIIPKEFLPSEMLYQELSKNINETEEKTRTEDGFLLPSEKDGMKLLWEEENDDNSLLILIIFIVAAVSIFIMGDKDLSQKVEDRKKQMTLEYPNFVSRLVLYMGSGMSVRAILMKFQEEYKTHISEGGKKSYLYEEIAKSCRELESGVPELNVYERFGIRCGSSQYARLVTLLSQNLKKGNSEMLNLLREESDKATLERMSYARKLGEEAGTKLLVPMIMMLLIVMVVIMVPAYLSF